MAVPYGNHDLGLLTLIDLIDGSDVGAGGGRVELSFSHDGVKWHRPSPRTRLIAKDDRSPNLFPIYCMTTPPIERDGRLWIYYTDASGLHSTRPLSTWTTRIRLASWRKDGFASLVADTRAELVTNAVSFEGQSLFLNCDVAKGGHIRVALLDEADKPIPGFDITDCKPVEGDSVSIPVEWKGELHTLAGRVVKVRIVSEKARLWSFRFGDQPKRSTK